MEGYLWYFEDDYFRFKDSNTLNQHKTKETRIAQYTLEGEFIREYASINEAERIYCKDGKPNNAIGHIFNPKMPNTTAFGYLWKKVY